MYKIVRKHLVAIHSAAAVAHRHQTTAAVAAATMKFTPKKYLPGKHYEGFLCESAKYIEDFNMTAYQFRHIELTSKYLHIDRADPNNVFSINFRTTPFDSTGIPHILEHSVLCGSELFPVRDPFFKMINRSMATFMNAMTGPDYTMYPFSSMNETDYRNLQQVYLDAVFRPHLNYLDFLQEGWRLEKSAATINTDSGLAKAADTQPPEPSYIIKGVVYNEMKGAFSENSNLIGSKFLNSILPDNTYGHCSGGEPLVIPQLTHDELRAFHKKYYHPSNARFFSYGSFPLKPTLRYINDVYLSKFKPIDTEFSKIPPQNRWSAAKREHINCRVDTMGAPIERQHQIAVGYLMTDIRDVYETFLMNVLTVLLSKGPNSPFYQSLIEPNISGGFSQMTGFESSIRDTMFVIGLQDVAAEDFEKIERIIVDTIDRVVNEGFEPDYVQSVLNNIELGLKHQSPTFGLGLLYNLTPIWNHEADIVKAVQYGRLVDTLRMNLLKNPRYLQDKVQQYFQRSQHKLTMTMSPSADYEQKFEADEMALIAKKMSKLNGTDRQRLDADAQALADSQKSPQKIDLLPCLALTDVQEVAQPAYRLDQLKVLVC